ncbi:MAG: NAD(P)H-hydrate epimerase [Elusimicrobia bacterium]|nr:NAD(P)H-hydrate epimerase [Candidatus Obscuribacterium magneticum]
MKPIILSVEQVRDVDRRCLTDYGIPTLLLMENAGRSLADTVEKQIKSLLQNAVLPAKAVIPTKVGSQDVNTGLDPDFRRDDGFRRKDVFIEIMCICGLGNNGGDGLVMSRHLFQRNLPIRLTLIDDPKKFREDAALNFRIIERIGVPVEDLSAFIKRMKAAEKQKRVVLVDAVLGTGFRGELRSPALEAIQGINKLKELGGETVTVVAADIPSGLNGDVGPVGSDAVKADVTVTFACLKPGLLTPEANPYVGKIEVADIGVPKKLLESYL